MAMHNINTVEDLFSYFGADYYEGDHERSESALSRRIYKDTSCGAWARFVSPGKRRGGKVKEKWTCSYKKTGDDWRPVSFSDANGNVVQEADLPLDVFDYFFPDVDSISAYLSEEHPGKEELTISEEVEVYTYIPHNGAFLIGSIVEGVDAEVSPVEVFLPCKGEDLDEAVKWVEDEAQRIWDETHGCSACNEDGEDGGSVNPECKECGGHGVPF